MYFVDFFKNLGRRANIPTIIYLILNIFVITAIMELLFGSDGKMPVWLAFLIGIALYFVSIVIALSPIGEWLLRMTNGCKKIQRAEIKAYIDPLFNEVYAKARQQEPSISDHVQLYMSDDECPNAFATGRKTVCITKGLLNLPPDQIKAILGHEFGHLAHKDTDVLLVIAVGNMIVNAFFVLVRAVVFIMHIIGSIVAAFGGGLADLMNQLHYIVMTAVVSGVIWLWTKIGVLLLMKSSRSKEYEADEFSMNLGYGMYLCQFFDSFESGKPSGLFAALASSHPDNESRIGNLQQKGLEYRSNKYNFNN